MRPRGGWNIRLALFILLPAGLWGLAGCGEGSSTISPPGAPVKNTLRVEVSKGPAGNAVNGIFTSVTICQPGSSVCQTIPNVLVDSGTVGLRLLSSAVTLPLPAVTVDGNALQECVSFADGSYVWGPVMSATIQLAGERAGSVPIQLIDSSSPTQYPIPNACTSAGGFDLNTVAALGANGLLGIGVFQQDCGVNCTTSARPNLYYHCFGSGCLGATVPLGSQLQNPVWMFPQDNNGVLISLPPIPAGGIRFASGQLIFGIGTQTNNGLGGAQVYTTDPNGNFTTTYHGVAYPRSYIDSGSDAYYFLNFTRTGMGECTNNPGWYCPILPALNYLPTFTVTNAGQNGTSGQVTFTIHNADALFSAGGGVNAAFSNIGASSGSSMSRSDYFDFGVPFFYGRNVFVGIENMTGPNGVAGPYWAY